MSYITKTDLENAIEATLLDALDFSADDSMIVTACSQAESQLRAYLSSRYNMPTEMAKAADTRNEMLVMLAKDLAIYHIWTYVDPTSIPASRKDRYQAAIDFLKSAQTALVSINIPVGETFSNIEGGSNLKRVNHY